MPRAKNILKNPIDTKRVTKEMWGWRLPSALFFYARFLKLCNRRKINNSLEQKNIYMKENSNDIEILKAMIKENFEEQRKLIAKLETVLEAVTSFNGKQMLDSRDMRLMLKVCDRTLIRWRNSGKLPFFKLSGKIYFWASDVYKFLREECLNEDFISDSINS